jgi:hypothetical protein
VPSSFNIRLKDIATCSGDGEPLSPIRFEINTTGLRKIMIVSEMLYPGERATELQQSLTQNVIDRDSWRNCANGTARTDCSVTAMLADWR